jgi:ABC-type transport system involved in cytochrome c biogenesis permease subunit
MLFNIPVARIVVHAVGSETIITHAVLMIMLCAGSGLLLGLATMLDDSLLVDKKRYFKRSNALFITTVGCIQLGATMAEAYFIYRDMQARHQLLIASHIGLLFVNSAACGLSLALGISKFKVLHRRNMLATSCELEEAAP